MAQHVHETFVFERRLRPIFDSLEAGFNKKALQEVDKLLKKSPSLKSSNCAKALKALALLRLNREEESNAILTALSEEKPCDDATLQVLTFCYKEVGQFEKICELYSHAVKQSPGNEELLAHLFMSYVRLYDYKNQQATALQLYKIKQKSPYYFWAVMSAILQAVRGPESNNPDKRKLFLALAQRMIDKLMAEDKLDAEQGVQLYVNILQEQEKFQETLEFIDGPICKKHYPGAPISIKIELLKKLEKWNELNDLLKELLANERDRWDYYKEYLKTCFELLKTKDGKEEKSAILENCLEFLCQLIEAGSRVRGPYLARLKLHRRMRENGDNAEELLGDHSELIVEYFRLFGHKPCCTNDIAMFLDAMSVEKRKKLASMLLMDSGISPTTLPQNKEQMQKHICSLQVSRICGVHNDLTTEHMLSLYTVFKLHYDHGYNQFGKDLLPTDMGPSDAYALLAAHVMFDASRRNNRSDDLLEGLCLLHNVLKNSPSNFHAKLLCLKIYHFFGCGVGAQQIYETLDIKNVQLDSMCYLHCLLLPSYGLPTIAKTVYDSTLRFFTTSYKERLEYIIMSYKFGSFTKLEEIMDFQGRLSNSLNYATVWAEKLLLEFVCMSGTVTQNLNAYKLMSLQPEDDRINWNQLSDNRDLSVVVQWDPIGNENQKNAMDVFQQDIELLQIRSLLLRLVSSVVDLLHFSHKIKPMNCVKSSLTSTLESLKESWDTLFHRLRSANYEKSECKFLVNLLPSRLHLILELPYEKFFSDLALFILTLCSSNEISDETLRNMNQLVSNVSETCCKAIEKQNNSEDSLWCQREVQEKVVASVEILALYCFILSVTHERLLMCSNVQHSKKNKRKDISQEMGNHCAAYMNPKDSLNVVVNLMKHLKQELQNCDTALANWKQPRKYNQKENCIADDMAKLSVNNLTDSIGAVHEIVQENHVQVLKELRNVIKDKLRMMNK